MFLLYSSTMLTFLSRGCWRDDAGGRDCRGTQLMVWGEDIQGASPHPAGAVSNNLTDPAEPSQDRHGALQASCACWHPLSLCSLITSPASSPVVLLTVWPSRHSPVLQAPMRSIPTHGTPTRAVHLLCLKPGGLLPVCPGTEDQ